MDLPGLFTEIAFRHLWQGVLIIGIVSLLLAGRRYWSAEHRSWMWTSALVFSAILPFVTLLDLPEISFAAERSAASHVPVPVSVSPTQAGLYNHDFIATVAMIIESLPLALILSALTAVWLAMIIWKVFKIFSAARQTRALIDTLEPCGLSTDMVPANWPSSIEILQSNAVGTPMAVGFFNCRVVMPASLVNSLPPHQIQHVLAHELAHIRRGDLQFALIQRLIEAVFWWSPVTWFIGRQLREEREMACDDRAVTMNGCQRQYATALLESVTVLVTKKRACNGDVLALSAFDHHSGRAFRLRIKRLIRKGYQPQISLGRVQMAGMSMAAAAILAMFFLTPRGVFDSELAADRPVMRASADEAVLVEFDLPLPEIISDLSGAPQTVKIHQPSFTYSTPESPEIPPEPRAFAIARSKAEYNFSTISRHSSIGSNVEEECEETGDHQHADASAYMHVPDIEVETIETSLSADAGHIDERTEIIVQTVENGKIVKRRIRHTATRSITLTAEDGTTMSINFNDNGDGHHQAITLSGSAGEITTIQ